MPVELSRFLPAFRFTLPAASCSLQSGLSGSLGGAIFGWVHTISYLSSKISPFRCATVEMTTVLLESVNSGGVKRSRSIGNCYLLHRPLFLNPVVAAAPDTLPMNRHEISIGAIANNGTTVPEVPLSVHFLIIIRITKSVLTYKAFKAI